MDYQPRVYRHFVLETLLSFIMLTQYKISLLILLLVLSYNKIDFLVKCVNIDKLVRRGQ